jgi:cyanophycin synthetase
MTEPQVAALSGPAVLPDPAKEIRVLTLSATRGMNYWSRRPVIRMDLRIGAYEDIASAAVPGFAESLRRVMPGLIEHHCSIGVQGGFLRRLHRGTYAPHIIEHVAIELQRMVGIDVGFGRTRGGDERGEYTLVFEHGHELVGLRAAGVALEIVQRAFAGTLQNIAAAVEELATLRATPDPPPLVGRVLCGITGSTHRAETQLELRRRLGGNGHRDAVVVDVAPAYVLQAGLPYASAELAIVLDAEPTDVPRRYRDPERARRLVSVLADAVGSDGVVICPAREWEIRDYARERGARVAIFAVDGVVTARDARVAMAVARVHKGRIVLERDGDGMDDGALDADREAVPQVVAALGAFVLRTAGERREP